MEEYYYLKSIRNNLENSVDTEYDKVVKFIDRKIELLKQEEDKFSARYVRTLEQIRSDIFRNY